MTGLKLDRKKIFILLLAWELAGVVVALILSLPKPSFHQFFDQLFICFTFTNSTAAFCAIIYLLYQKLLKNRELNLYIIIPVMVVLLTSIIIVSIKLAVFCGAFVCGLDSYKVNEWHLLIITINIVLITTSSIICVLYFLHVRLTASLETKLKENEELQRLQIESKFSILQSKVNPHFLFNTLNTMLGMVHKQPEKVEKIIFNLSDIYRKVLSLPDNALITLENELELIREYLEIEKTRMGDRLNYSIDVDNELKGVEVPPLMLQIIVENAIIHGLSPKKEGGKVEIKVEPSNDNINIIVTDNGVGVKTNYRSSGFGIYSIIQRLKLIYAGKAAIEISPVVTGGTIVTIKLPYENKNNIS